MIKRGDIYYIRGTRQTTGSEQRAGRPAVIVSNNENNAHSTVYEVVYMTTKQKADLPTHFITCSSMKPSTVLCEQINSVCRDRVGERIGALEPDEIEKLDRCLEISLGIKRGEDIRHQLDEARQQAKEYKEAHKSFLRKQLKTRE